MPGTKTGSSSHVMASHRASRDSARRSSTALARSHYENFTVLSLLLPRALRQDVANLYAYCRTVDDLGDEAPGDRLALLEQWENDLMGCFGGQPRHRVLVALQDTIGRHHLPAEPFLRLLAANKRDQVQSRYDTWDELLGYCSCSANPVGRLYLQLIGYTDAKRQELADATCTALQLANFWQDISRDSAMGRIYVPREELRAFGVTEAEVIAGRDSPASAQLLARLCERTEAYFARGLPLLQMLPWRLAYNVRLFSLGGLAILRAVGDNRAVALSRRPVLRAADKWRIAIRALLPLTGGGAN